MPDGKQLLRWVRRGVSQSPATTIRSIQRKTAGARDRNRARQVDLRRTTYSIDIGSARLGRRLGDLSDGFAPPNCPAIAGATVHALRHEFDLLGSGRVRVTHGIACTGMDGHAYPPKPVIQPDPDGAWLRGRMTEANAAESSRIWQLVDVAYEPIDWQLDFKSGYRWSESTWYRDIAYGHLPGVDVKVPWELARMQHLPQLAIAAALAGTGMAGFEAPETYLAEFRNQVLDFVATNPPRFGVNWCTTMDVAIRAANLLLAHDLFLAGGFAFDDAFRAVFARSIAEHGRHIAENLEWDPNLRGNHYLADLAGLAFVGAYLRGDPEGSRWLERATTELWAEVGLQFNADGTNFEGSTSYHRLAVEMVLWTTALLLGLPDGHGRVPAGLGDRISRMVAFTRAVTGPDGRVAQVGDNDSGRFFKLEPGADRESLDHRHLIDAALGIVDVGSWPDDPPSGLSRRVAAALARGERLQVGAIGATTEPEGGIGDRTVLEGIRDRIRFLPEGSRAAYLVPGEDIAAGLRLEAFPDGGYWVAQSDRMHLAIRCGPVGQRGHGGHDHDDQLSFDLSIDGRRVVADPGTFVYTSWPAQRNAYRSAAAHSGPLPDGPEPAGLERGLFELVDARDGECLAWGEFGFAGRLRDRLGRELLTVIEWTNEGLRIDHGIRGGLLHASRRTGNWQALRSSLPFSPAYGLQDP